MRLGLAAALAGVAAFAQQYTTWKDAIRKGQVRWVSKGDAVAQRQFIHTGIAA